MNNNSSKNNSKCLNNAENSIFSKYVASQNVNTALNLQHEICEIDFNKVMEFLAEVLPSTQSISLCCSGFELIYHCMV